jgi:hypothetical protein
MLQIRICDAENKVSGGYLGFLNLSSASSFGARAACATPGSREPRHAASRPYGFDPSRKRTECRRTCNGALQDLDVSMKAEALSRIAAVGTMRARPRRSVEEKAVCNSWTTLLLLGSN